MTTLTLSKSIIGIMRGCKKCITHCWNHTLLHGMQNARHVHKTRENEKGQTNPTEA